MMQPRRRPNAESGVDPVAFPPMPFVGRAEINATEAAAQADRRIFSLTRREVFPLSVSFFALCEENTLSGRPGNTLS
jgi:hypothetical protein